MSVTRSPEVEAATAGPLQKVTAEARGSNAKRMAVIPLMLAGIAIPGIYYYLKFSAPATADEVVVTPKSNYTGEDLEARVKRVPTPAAPKEERPAPTPTADRPEPMTTPIVEKAEEPKGKDWEWVRARTVDSMVVVEPEKPAVLPATSSGGGGPRSRHVPRGTVMTALLESRIRSDNLDSRVRATLLEDFRLGGDVILPAGGWFIGDAGAVASRYQDRVAVRISSYVYPDREREVEFQGLLLNMDESAHLVADDKQQHTGKLIAGIAALELLHAATAVVGASGSGNDVLVSVGSSTMGTVSDTATPRFEHLMQIMPTLLVEPGKPVYVFVDQSFDVPAFRELPEEFVKPASPSSPNAPAPDPRLDRLMAQLEQLRKLSAGLPTAPPAGPPGIDIRSYHAQP